jgi:hypothetical protein
MKQGLNIYDCFMTNIQHPTASPEKPPGNSQTPQTSRTFRHLAGSGVTKLSHE